MRVHKVLALGAAAALVLAGCGGSDSSVSDGGSAATTSAGGSATSADSGGSETTAGGDTATTAGGGDTATTTGGGDSSGEAGGGTYTGDPVTLKLLAPTYSDNTKGIWEGLISDFQAANPNITIELEVQSWDNINDVVRTKIQGNDAPDILNIDAFAAFAADELLYPASDVASQTTLDDFQTSFADNASVDGTMYGFPLIASSRALFYNSDLLDQAGISDPPKTWDDLKAAAEAVSALGDDTYGYGMPLGSEEAQAEMSVWVFGAGGSWTDGTNVTVDTPEAQEAATFIADMASSGLTEPDPGATDRSPLMNVFIQGSIGMMVGLPPTIDQIAERNPDLKYDIAPIPTKDGSPVTLGVADHLMAFDNGEDKAEAIKAFMDYFFTTENYLKFADGEGFLPTTKSGAEQTANKDKFQAFLDLLPNAQFYPSTNPQWPVAQGALQSQAGLIAQGDDPAGVLAAIQSEVDAG